MRGPRVALAESESLAEGTICEFKIGFTHPLLEEHIRDALDYGENKGIGQWRNGGKGRFRWEEIPVE